MNSFFVEFDLVNVFNGKHIIHHEEIRQAESGELACIQAHDDLSHNSWKQGNMIVGKRINEKFKQHQQGHSTSDGRGPLR